MKATLHEIARSLEGNWREELVFVLSRRVELRKFYRQKIADCDVRLRKHPARCPQSHHRDAEEVSLPVLQTH
ncbi:MAG: hypothetical protein ABSB15_12250 [Bryobacteraceae bacterium]